MLKKLAFTLPAISTLLGVSLCSIGALAQPVTPAEFRDIFLGALDGQHNPDEMQRLVYLPSSSDLTPDFSKLSATPSRQSAQAVLDLLADHFRAPTPLSLFHNGQSVAPSPWDSARIERALRTSPQGEQGPLTIVIVPGIFGEFIKTRGFEEVFARDRSAFRDLWNQRLSQYRSAVAAGRADASQLSDSQFSLKTLEDEKRDLSDLFHVSSIDDASGKPLINFVLFSTPMLSLETVGRIEDDAASFSRRLDKFMRIMNRGAEPGVGRMALIGYSQGTIVALEMLARARESASTSSWLPHVRAMISLGGVVYGSDLADQAANARGESPAPASTQQLTLLRQLKDTLKTVNLKEPEAAKTIRENTQAWSDFLRGMAALGKGADKGSVSADPQKSQLGSLAHADLTAGVQIVMEFGVKNFMLQSPFQYNSNILRFKELAQQVLDGVQGLTTASRLDWWSKNIVPSDIAYYAVSGTMADDTVPGEESALATNPTTFNPELNDYQFLAQNYRDFKKYSGITVNDSQMAFYKTRVWNELNHALNPAQPELDTALLGVFGTHHWGLCLRTVLEMNKLFVEDVYDPFPRVALLKAIAVAVQSR